jgi:pimeloyl-ACP methyl ester carboxylesterase
MICRLISLGILLLASRSSFVGQTTLPSGRYLDVGGAKLWYEECGTMNVSAPALVLLHDGLLHSITWDGIWTSLCANYHVLRYDRRGYGRSEAAKGPFVPEDDLYKIMNQAHMNRSIIVGNSSGAGLALDFALAHPQMVDALVLIGPVVHGMASSDYFNERGSRNSAPLGHGDVKGAAENWSKDRFLIAGDDPTARRKLYDALLQNPQNLHVEGALETRPSPPAAERLAEIKVPALILVGDADIADVFAYSGAIEAALPLAHFEVWKDTGHLIQLQRPAELISRLNRFVALAQRREAAISDKQLEACAGQYELFNHIANVTLKDHHLVLEFPGDPRYWLFAESDVKFFLRTEDTNVEFTKDTTGKAVEIVIRNSDGSTIKGARLNSGSSH